MQLGRQLPPRLSFGLGDSRSVYWALFWLFHYFIVMPRFKTRWAATKLSRLIAKLGSCPPSLAHLADQRTYSPRIHTVAAKRSGAADFTAAPPVPQQRRGAAAAVAPATWPPAPLAGARTCGQRRHTNVKCVLHTVTASLRKRGAPNHQHQRQDVRAHSVVRCAGVLPAARMRRSISSGASSWPCAAPAARVMLSFMRLPPMSLHPAAMAQCNTVCSAWERRPLSSGLRD